MKLSFAPEDALALTWLLSGGVRVARPPRHPLLVPAGIISLCPSRRSSLLRLGLKALFALVAPARREAPSMQRPRHAPVSSAALASPPRLEDPAPFRVTGRAA